MGANGTDRRPGAGRSPLRPLGLVLGPVLALALGLAEPPAGCPPAAWATAAVTVLMATWWVTEALPLPVTALVPLPLLPLLGVADTPAVAQPYADPLVFLFLGGFLLAAGVRRHGLHRRVALAVVALAGPRPDRLVAGLLLATAVISMWVSNTATAAMMLPIALALLALASGDESGGRAGGETGDDDSGPLAPALLLAIAFGANIGGMATLVGTPPNALLAGFLERQHGIAVGFGEWMLVGLPVAALLLVAAWWLLARAAFAVGRDPLPGVERFVADERIGQGAMSPAQRRVAIVVGIAIAGWLTRPLLQWWLPGAALTDPGIAIACGIALFLVPTGRLRGPALLEWRDTGDLAWGVLILVGGGLSLGAAVQDSGLAGFIAGQMAGLRDAAVLGLVAVLAVVTIVLSHVTSNTATTATLLPIAVGLGEAGGASPLALAAAVALSASCAFMLPVATPPNAIVFASERLRVVDMVRGGAGLVGVALVVVALAAWGLAPAVLG